MADNTDPNWRNRFSTNQQSDRRAVEDTLETTPARVVIIVICAIIVIGAVIGTFAR